MRTVPLKNILFLFLVLVVCPTQAQTILLDTADSQSKDISSLMQIYEDESDNLTIDEAIEKPYHLNGKKYFLFPFSNSAFWIKLEFEKSNSAEEEWVIQFKNELIEYITFYEPSKSGSGFQQTGDWDILSSRRLNFKGQEPYYNFKIASAKTIYARIETKRAIYGHLHVYPASLQNQTNLNDLSQRSFINGLLIFRLLLVLTIGLFVIKDKVFRVYSFLILMKTFGYWGLTNTMGAFLANNPQAGLKLNFLFYALTPISTIIFSLVVLPFVKLPGWTKKSFYWFLGATILVHLLVQISYQSMFLQAGIAIIVLSGIYIFTIYGYSFIKKYEVHKYYSIPFLIGLLGYFLMNLRILTQKEFRGVDTLAMFLFLAEILVFTLYLGRMFREGELKKALAEQKLENEKEQSEKLKEIHELKSSFFTNISHELKTPLTLISGPISELIKKYPQEKLLKMTNSNVDRLQQLVNQILDIQKLEAGKQRPVIKRKDLAKYLRMHILSFESLAESKEIMLNLKQSSDKYFAFFDEDMLSKILDNLISNAIKYSSKGSKIEVEAVYSENPKSVKLTVSDTGFGISATDLPFIFDRFYQVNSSNHLGSGVGLALVKELIELLKGSIEVKSELNSGTRFEITLPIDRETWQELDIEEFESKEVFSPTKESLLVKELALDRNSKKEIILLVEDNPDMQEYLKMLLEGEYNIMQAFNGEEGIEKAKAEVPDIIICDLMMPKLDGFGFSKAIRNNVSSSHVPIIMLTAKSSKETKIESFEIGIDQYLTKPFDADELKSAIHGSLESRKNLRAIFSKDVIDLKPSEVKVNPLEKQFIETLKAFLEANYSNSNLGVQDIASVMKMSDTQLRRKLKSISSYSPNEYLRKFRLQKAEGLLKSNGLTVSQIAFEVGYENLSYFSKVFQEEFGYLPSESIPD